jgi:dTMP kinase
MNTPRFISLEGCEGCGKSTQAAVLRDWIQAKGGEVVMTREPGGTPTGEMIRDLLQHHVSGEAIAPTTEVLLFAASRAQHVAHVIQPALEAGKWVVCDRFLDSSLAYQAGGRGIDLEEVFSVNAFALQGCLPSLTLWFDVPVETALARVADRGEQPDRFESENIAFHTRVSEAYAKLHQRFPDRVVRIDAGGDVESVSNAMVQAVQERWGAEA